MKLETIKSHVFKMMMLTSTLTDKKSKEILDKVKNEFKELNDQYKMKENNYKIAKLIKCNFHSSINYSLPSNLLISIIIWSKSEMKFSSCISLNFLYFSFACLFASSDEILPFPTKTGNLFNVM